ncbi:ricin-type beta-trefoil lectin domain protein [Rhizoctonia solani]|uniref:Ricin-type beta-trefoil lectin domain protein n=1 Tax=Rhizoctonia solani TaxID=456999 RepID=A0A8H8P0M2_9AGAM|nr:ricin-type beta-trefoil lectin domain protein [Rhizoctonia solani]QRW23359.1 ricin-type beta-trefoil lectin domain protein [Rhizoctonia solani]
MGQDIYNSPHPPDEDLKPGTYRIFNPTAGTAIQMSYHDPAGIVAWGKHGGENQQGAQRIKWFLQRSGHGYQLQNRRYGTYLAVCDTNNGGLVYASRYPTTWLFLKYDNNYLIQIADKNRILNLYGCSRQNGTLIHIYNLDGTNMTHRIWGLERLGDGFGNDELVEIRDKVTNQNREMTQLREELTSAKQEIMELRGLLIQRYRDIRQQETAKDMASFPSEIDETPTDLYNQHKLLKAQLSQ